MVTLDTPLLIHQPSYSLLNRWTEDRLLDVLGAEGVGCIAFSVLAQGLLTDRYLNGIPPGSRADRGGSVSSIGRCTVPVMMTGAVDQHRPMEKPGCQGRRCRCTNARRSLSR